MKLVDMSHLMNVHTPGWVGYAGNKMYYAQNLQTKMMAIFNGRGTASGPVAGGPDGR